jgi:hypothetical protein
MWRPDTSTDADRVRQADSFAPGTGTLTHSGANYSDTTATSESLILLPPELDPYKVRVAANMAVKGMREWDETNVPARRLANGEYHLADLSWLNDAAAIREIKWRRSTILSRNRDMQKWRAVNASGVLSPPDFWTLAGTSATVTRGTTNLYDGPYVATLTRSGSDATLLQTVGILPTGVSGDSLRGQTVTAVLRVRATVASRIRVRIYENGTATASSSFHTGGSTYEVLTCSVTIGSTTDVLTFGASLESGDTSVNIAECYLALEASVSDGTYRDDSWAGTIPKNQYHFEQGGPLKLHIPSIGTTGQFLVCSERPFPGFDAARLASGAADTDEQDAPLDEVATGIVAITLEQRYGPGDATARLWRKKFDLACRKHLAYPTGNTGMPLLNGPITAPAMRVR